MTRKRKDVGKPASKTPKGPARAPSPAGAEVGTASAPVAPHQNGKWAEWFVRAPGERRFWLVKSEPGVFSFDDLMRAKNRTTGWDGVRNSAARNFLRDGMKPGDLAFFYHSMAEPQAIVGICEVVSEPYPDPTALDPAHPQFDEDSSSGSPTWFQVDVRAVAPLARPVTLPELKARPELATMALIRIGRLSVTPVRASEWEAILEMGSAR